MKAILAIDMPSNCAECPLRYWGIAGWSCICTRRLLEGSITEREEWCPLRPLPKKLYVKANQIEDLMPSEFDMDKLILKIQLDADKLCALGWNACLKEITGETE